ISGEPIAHGAERECLRAPRPAGAHPVARRGAGRGVPHRQDRVRDRRQRHRRAIDEAARADRSGRVTKPIPIDYATRDYEGFRHLFVAIVQRHDTKWTERSAADVGIMVLELLAYELGRLAYAGDRVAEEGFLATARRRESTRRHAALGDYQLDRGN